MKTKSFILAASLVLATAASVISCSKLGYGKLEKGDGRPGGNGSASAKRTAIEVHFIRQMPGASISAGTSSTRGTLDYPDTNSFILTVTDSKGVKIYNGSFGAAPSIFEVSPGSYTVRAVSCDFSSPLFECPQFGDEQVVTVSDGQHVNALLSCAQLNSGLRLNVDYSFRVSYPDAVLYVKSTEGRLMYTYPETRIGYFLPGSVTLQMEQGGSQTPIFTRILEAQQILTVNLSAAGGPVDPSGSGIRMVVDTCRYWLEEDYCFGQDGGGSIEDALGIDEAKSHIGDKGVWVYGYIVGGDMTSSSCSFEAPFTSRTNIAIAAKSSCTDKAACIAVQLQKGDIRDALNLVDNPGLLGKRVFLKGNIVEAYFGITGLQNLSEYKLQ